MPFGTARADDYDNRGPRLDPVDVQIINGYRSAWGVPPVTSTGVYDPTGVVHEAERGQRVQRAGEIVRGVGLALKVFGFLTANEVLKKIGKALTEVAKRIAEEAADMLAELPDDILKAFVDEYAHALVVHQRITEDRDLVLRWNDAHAPIEANAIAFYNAMLLKERNGGTLTTAERAQLEQETPLRARRDSIPYHQRLAAFLPVTRAPAVRELVPGAATRGRLDCLTHALRETSSVEAVAARCRQPTTPQEWAFFDAQAAPFRAINVLRPAALRVVQTLPGWWEAEAERSRVAAEAKREASLSLARDALAASTSGVNVNPRLTEVLAASIPSPAAIAAAQAALPAPTMPAPPAGPVTPPLALAPGPPPSPF